MQFFKNVLALSALASVVVADNTITFVNQDSKNRTILFTPSVPHPDVEDIQLDGSGTQVVQFPQNWVGNFWARDADSVNPNREGMLGEISFTSWAGLTFFDVSAIVDPTDVDGIKQIFPKNSNTPIAGCQEYPCTSDVYNVWNDDLATKSSLESDLVCLVGNLASQSARRRAARAGRAAHSKRVAEPLTGESATEQ